VVEEPVDDMRDACDFEGEDERKDSGVRARKRVGLWNEVYDGGDRGIPELVPEKRREMAMA
jgi:hypothetical protein